jgi:hypothetical protein
MRSGGWFQGLVGLVGLTMLLGGPAWSQQQKPTEPPPITGQPAAGSPPASGEASPGAIAAPAPVPAAPTAAASPDPLSATRLMDGPSLHETGRIAIAPAPAPMSLIENEGPLTSPNEKSIAHAASTLGTAPAARRAGVIPPAVLDREITEHFTEIGGCRVEVARVKQVTPTQVTADRLLLRWIIEPDGTTGPTDVVAVAPVDLAIMDCAKRVMSQWKFTPPRGGSMTVERPYAF